MLKRLRCVQMFLKYAECVNQQQQQQAECVEDIHHLLMAIFAFLQIFDPNLSFFLSFFIIVTCMKYLTYSSCFFYIID